MQSSTFRMALLLRFWIFFPPKGYFFPAQFYSHCHRVHWIEWDILSMSHGSEDKIPVPFMVEQEWTSDTHFSPISCAPQPFFNHSVFKMYSGLFNRAFYGCTSEKKKKKSCTVWTSVVTWWLSTVPNPAGAPVLIPVCAGGFQALP